MHQHEWEAPACYDEWRQFSLSSASLPELYLQVSILLFLWAKKEARTLNSQRTSLTLNTSSSFLFCPSLFRSNSPTAAFVSRINRVTFTEQSLWRKKSQIKPIINQDYKTVFSDPFGTSLFNSSIKVFSPSSVWHGCWPQLVVENSPFVLLISDTLQGLGSVTDG